MPGFERGRNLVKVGMKAQDTAELFFHEVRLTAGNVVGTQGAGFGRLMDKLYGGTTEVMKEIIGRSLGV